VRLTRLRPAGIGGKRVGADAKLAGDKMERRLRDDLARPKQPAGIAKRAELQSITELVVSAAPTLNGRKVGRDQGPVADEIRLAVWKRKQALELRLGERASSRHGYRPK